MLARLLIASLFLVYVAAPAAAQQQQLPATALSLPNGITVETHAAVPVRSWLTAISFQYDSSRTTTPAAADTARMKLVEALQALGARPDDIATIPDVGQQANSFNSLRLSPAAVYVTLPLGELARARSAAKANHFAELSVDAVPANAEELYERAEAMAILQARSKATALAAADHEHIGRLINFTPSPVDLAREQMAGGIISLFVGVSDAPGMVTASGLATFEIVP